MTTEKLKVAICGGGIASLCLAHSLAKQSHLDVKIFEKSAVLRDEGASVGLGANALQGLSLISPELRAAIDEAGGVPMDPTLRVMLATGPNAGKHVYDLRRGKMVQTVVHWGALYRALYKRIPESVLQLGKQAVGVTYPDSNSSPSVLFDDGSSYEADVIVGCDGINSVIRKTILGAGNPASDPVFSDRMAHRVVIPMESAKAIFGEAYCSVPTQHVWIGESLLLLTDHANNSTAMQVIADFEAEVPWPHSSPYIPWPEDKLRKNLRPCGDTGTDFATAFLSLGKLFAACHRYHLDTPTFSKGQVCVVGDAALAFLPAHGAGAGQAIEDALILSSVLGVASSREDIIKGLQIYDSIRRPRRTEVARLSDWAMLILTGRDADAGLDPDGLVQKFSTWGTKIVDYDLAGSQQEALTRMKQEA